MTIGQVVVKLLLDLGTDSLGGVVSNKGVVGKLLRHQGVW